MDEKQLKYLGFVQAAAIYVILLVTSFYEYAKSNSGPLKSGILTVEGAVTAVIGPVYHQFHHVPFQLLLFVDRKVRSAPTTYLARLDKNSTHDWFIYKRVDHDNLCTMSQCGELNLSSIEALLILNVDI